MDDDQSLADNGLSKVVDLEEGNSMLNSLASNCSDSNKNSANREGMDTQVHVKNVLSEIFVYRQDVVTCGKHEGLLGVVTEVAGDADSEDSMTDSDSEDDANGTDSNCVGGDGDGDGGNENGNADGGESGDIDDSLPDGQVRVIWIDASETAENVSDVTVVDRSFLHGDIVASASDPTGQMGLVLDVSITVDLLAEDGQVIKQISSKDLKLVREPLVGDYVILGPWLGRVDDVLDNVTVLFDDGSICKVVKADPLRLKPLSRPVTDETSCPFYPGQRVRGVSSSVFKGSRWLSGLWKANRLEGTVIKVQAASVVVYWIASAHLGMGTNSTVPSEEQDPKNLTLLSCFAYANWQLGDWCHLPDNPLAASSLDDKASKPRKEQTEESRCNIDHSEEHPDPALDGHDSVHGDNHTPEMPNPETAIQDEIKPSHVTTLGDDQRDGCHGKSSKESELKPQGHNSTSLHETKKASEHIGTGSNNVLPECGSCSSSSSVSKEQTHESWPAYRKKLRKVFFKRDKKPRRRDEAFERSLLIVNIMSKVDVAWQDGTRGYGLESKSLIPINTPNDHEFFPEQYVVENTATEGENSSETNRVGVVRSVNSKERTVSVRWFKPVSNPEDSREFDCDEVVSAYELDQHPDYDYCYGDVVVRLSPVSVSAVTTDCGSLVDQFEQPASLAEAEADQSMKHADHVEVDQTAIDVDYENFTSLSWVGHITGLQDGDIEVTWADGMVSKVGPQAVFVVGREDDGDSFDGGSEISDDAASWETVDENEMGKFDDAEEEADKQSSTDNVVEIENQTAVLSVDNNTAINGALSVPLAALGFVSRLATGLFSRDKKQSELSHTSEHMDAHEPDCGVVKVSDGDAFEGVPSSEVSNNVDNLSEHHNASGSTTRHTDVSMSEDEETMDTSKSLEIGADSTGADNKDISCSFKHFDIADYPLDNHFTGSSQSSGERKWVKKVQKDWGILEKNLPDAIYVRVFEERMDLLRAVIVGACGTPYQDGLFFFDFHLPPEYPQVPPSAYYHSGGLRVNPNLYVDGKVCLSLLNTWTGRGNEVWDPSSSSILQVLVSLQGLVLNSKPYFNEAGYEKQVGTVEGEKNVLPYNENTYLLNLKSMLYLLRRPPMHFEDFVKDHFRSRGHCILKACKAYMEGCMIGSLTKDASPTGKSTEHLSSVGFKLMLAKILPRLISALSELGLDCHEFENLQSSDNL